MYNTEYIGEKFVFFCYAKADKLCRIGVQISDGKTVYVFEKNLCVGKYSVAVMELKM